MYVETCHSEFSKMNQHAMQAHTSSESRDAERSQLLSRLKKAGVSERVTTAMMQVPRDRFVPAELRRHAWTDESLPIGRGQTISQPSLVGRMIDRLKTQKTHRILDIGTGSGYQAAILSLLVTEVVGVERVDELRTRAAALLNELGYDNVKVMAAGEQLGYPELAPYDGIIVGAAAPEVPDSLVKQLKIGGRLVIPVGTRDAQELLIVERTKKGTREKRDEYVRFVPLIGKDAWAG